MDDLTNKIESLLNSPNGMQKIQAAMAALGQSAPENGADSAEPAAPSAGPDLISQLLSGLGGSSDSASAKPESDSGGMPDLGKLMQFLPLLSGMNGDDENTALLKALRPHLHGEREKRVDDAIQMMKFMKLVPLITDQKKLP